MKLSFDFLLGILFGFFGVVFARFSFTVIGAFNDAC